MTILTEDKAITNTRRRYIARLARNTDEICRAQQLRFEVFNLELGEGLAASHALERDVDPFDAVCDHLVVEHRLTGQIVGTYRLQTGTVAAANLGYYSEREFDFAPYESLRREMIELGRACVHADHRNFNLLHLLWRGIAQYAAAHGARFLIGCSSIGSQNPKEGEAFYQRLALKHLIRPELRTNPHREFAMAGGVDPGRILPQPASAPSSKLLRAYLSIGAKICGAPAIDREFWTIDFLTLLDLQALPAIVRAHFFG